MEYIVCFTGHRPNKLPWGYNESLPSCIAFKKDLYDMLEKAIQNNYNYFISGLALGIDLICAETVLELKKKYPNVKLEGAIPCANQDARWNEPSKKRYAKVVNQCDYTNVLSSVYTDDCMNDRNKYMVEKSDVVIAIWNGKPSGTGNTVKFAKEKGCKIKIINPDDYR